MDNLDMLEAKKKIIKLFPQLANKNFKIWHNSINDENTFYLQCYEGTEFYGHEYKVNIAKKTLEFIGNKKTEKRYAIVSVNLQYELPENVKTDKQVKDFVENLELPKEYVEDSFEFVKVAK